MWTGNGIMYVQSLVPSKYMLFYTPVPPYVRNVSDDCQTNARTFGDQHF